MNEEKQEKLQQDRKVAKGLGWAVYGGVIVTAWAFSLALFTSAFPDNAFLRFISGLGVSLIALNAVALPIALHRYAVSGWHRGAAIAMYAADMLIMALNVLVSAGELIGFLPAWAKGYEPYAYSSIVVPLATWGLLWILDPYHKADVQLQTARQKFMLQVIKRAAAIIDEPEGRDIVQGVAQALAHGYVLTPDVGGVRLSDTGSALGGASLPPTVEQGIMKVLAKAGLDGQSKQVYEEIVAQINPTPASIKRRK